MTHPNDSSTGNHARKYQPTYGERWTFPEPAPQHRAAPAPRSTTARTVSWVVCIVAVALFVASVAWLLSLIHI